MADHYAVVWTAAGGTPRPIGQLVVTDTEYRFSYRQVSTRMEADSDISLLEPRSVLQDQALTRVRTTSIPIHPSLLHLIPNNSPHNLQRRIILGYLKRKGIVPSVGFEEDWQLLLAGGRNAIGHLDVFSSDEAAETWYAKSRPLQWVDATRLGDGVRQALTAQTEELANVEDVLPFGATPNVIGAMPKLLLSIPQDGWTGQVAAPGVRAAAGAKAIDVMLKIETSDYEGIVDLEALCYDIHHDAGFATPKYWKGQLGEYRALAVERFDRDAKGFPIALESIQALMSLADAKHGVAASGNYEAVGKLLALRRDQVRISEQPDDDRRELFARIVMALLTGNGDLHLENLAILGQSSPRLAMVYDPAPMRAWARHRILTAVGFGCIPACAPYEYASLPQDLASLASSLKVGPTDAQTIVEHCLANTATYTDRVNGLDAVPDVTRRALIQSVSSVRRSIGQFSPKLANAVPVVSPRH